MADDAVKNVTDGAGELNAAEEIKYRTLLEAERVKATEIKKQLDEMQGKLSKYKDVDPEKYREYQEKVQQMEEQKLIDSNDVEKLLELRVVRMKQEHEGKTRALEEALNRVSTEKATLASTLSELLIDSQIQQMVNRIGKPSPGAYVDILARAKSTFRIIDNVPTPVRPDGTVIYSKDGKEPMSFDEFGLMLQEQAPHLWESVSGGGGSTGSSGPRAGGTDYISANDPIAFGKNLKDIASGKVKVR